MFDNLKEKLGSFRKDVEETAEENVEPVEDGDGAEGDGETATEGVAEDGEGSPAEGDGEPATLDAESADGESESAADDVPAEIAPAAGAAGRASAAEDAEVAGQAGSTGDAGVAGTAAEGHDADGEPATDDIEGEPATDDVDEEPTADDAEGESADEESSTGLGRKARSLVRGKFVIEADDLEGPLQELELALLSSDVEMGVAEEILENIRGELVGETRTFTTSTGDVVEEALKDAIREVISVGQFDFDERVAEAEKPLVIVFTGVNGVGKTTSIAKLHRYFEERGYSTVLANGDTYRAGANEQIAQHAEALDAKLISHDQGGDPAAVLYDAVEYAEANDVDVVLGDTAGRLHTNEGLMDQLEKIGRVVDPDMTLFVDEAVAGQDAVNRAREFDEAIEIDGAILTKADADANGGAAISVAHVTGKPILFLGVGQGYDDIERFDPDELVDRLLAE